MGKWTSNGVKSERDERSRLRRPRETHRLCRGAPCLRANLRQGSAATRRFGPMEAED